MADDRARQDGFTLIELLVVVVIIGVLASIAIPTFLSQREKAHRSQAVSDMKNAGLALETWATDHDGSYAGLDGATQVTPALTDEGFNASDWVALSVTATVSDFCILGTNEKVPGKEFVLRSSAGRVEIVLDGSTTC